MQSVSVALPTEGLNRLCAAFAQHVGGVTHTRSQVPRALCCSLPAQPGDPGHNCTPAEEHHRPAEALNRLQQCQFPRGPGGAHVAPRLQGASKSRRLVACAPVFAGSQQSSHTAALGIPSIRQLHASDSHGCSSADARAHPSTQQQLLKQAPHACSACLLQKPVLVACMYAFLVSHTARVSVVSVAYVTTAWRSRQPHPVGWQHGPGAADC